MQGAFTEMSFATHNNPAANYSANNIMQRMLWEMKPIVTKLPKPLALFLRECSVALNEHGNELRR